MIPGQFDYVRPGDLEGALTILREREGEAKLLSGGYSLIPLIKLRLAQPGVLVDMRDIGGLDGMTENDDELRIGARATHRQIHENEIITERYPGMRELAGHIGDPQVRNWGTIGGSIAHADPASDWPAMLLALGATVVCRSQGGERLVKARDFFLDTFTTALEPTEVLTEIRFPRRPLRAGGAYTKLERKVGDFATCGAAAAVRLAQDGSVEWVGIGITGVAEVPFEATRGETALHGSHPTDDMLHQAASAAAAQTRPAADIRGSVEYKQAMAAELTVRSLRRAVERAQAYV